jgi:putative transposase
MPNKGVVKQNLPDTFYHVYNRVWKEKLFRDDSDYTYFYKLINRYLGEERVVDKAGTLYPNFNGLLEINCFCLMPTHFHFVVYQKELNIISFFMRSLMNSYVIYYNKKYKKRGKLFESIYKSKPILMDEYLLHITRYIHLNPRDYTLYSHSSYRNYTGEIGVENWLVKERVLELFHSISSYKKFVNSYKKTELDKITMSYLLAE